MALLGGGVGGAGNPVGGSFTGPATALEYTEDRVYGYSGVLTLDAVAFQDFFNFTTGSHTIVCDIHFTGDYDELGANNITTQISMNGNVIVFNQAERNNNPNIWPITLVIPPYTQLQIEGMCQGATPDFTCLLTGTVLRN